MKRLFWVALGASVGILVVREARKTAASMTPGALAGSLREAIRDFGAELRLGMAERETQLRRDLGLDEVTISAEPMSRWPGGH